MKEFRIEGRHAGKRLDRFMEEIEHWPHGMVVKAIRMKKLKVNGKTLTARHPLMSMNAGMAYLPEDRKNEGIIADLSVRENLIMALQAKRGIFHLLSRKQQEEFTDKYIEMLQIKTASRETPIKSLSGGNQQKVVISKYIDRNIRVLILDEPTRGIDVGAKDQIYEIIEGLAQQGMAVIVISSEIPELQLMCDRICVMSQGKVTTVIDRSEFADSDNILRNAIGI